MQNYSIENCKDTCVFWWAAQVTPWSEWRLQFHRAVTFDVRPVSQPGGDMGWQQQKKLERFHSQWKTASTDTSDNTHWRKVKEMHIGEKSNNCNIKTGGNNKIKFSMENCFPFLRLLLTHLKVCYWSLQIYTFVVTGEDQKQNLIPKRVATKISSIKVPFRDRKSCASPKRAPNQVTNQQYLWRLWMKTLPEAQRTQNIDSISWE